jgi:chromosome partitioning protein
MQLDNVELSTKNGVNMALQRVSMEDLDKLAVTAADVLEQVRHAIIAPHPLKVAPTFTSPTIAEMCGIDKTQVKYLTQKHDLPVGRKIEGSKAKEYSLEDAIEWVRKIGNRATRPKDKLGKVIAVCNYKGGVAKTSTCVALAQALTLRGLKVLLIDCDGQGTATQLSGISPEHDVEMNQTIMPFIYDDQPDLRYAVQETYWHNLSIIPASSGLLGAEFALPGKAMSTRGFRFWEVLRNGIAPLREEYDLILIDTSPSLSHLTVNAMIAADGLIMPCPPEALDFASSVQFWGIFSELIDSLPEAKKKIYDFISIVYTRVATNDLSLLVKMWMTQAYGVHINGIEIPESRAAQSAAAQLKTVYDLSKPDGSLDAYRRYKEPLDRLADFVLNQLALAWSNS